MSNGADLFTPGSEMAYVPIFVITIAIAIDCIEKDYNLFTNSQSE